MKLLKQLALIAGFSVVGEIISYLLKEILGIFIPGSLIGMIILFILLTTKLIKYDFVDDVGEFFVNNMGFFFVPVAVSIMNYFGILAPIWWKLLLIIIISFFLTFVSVGLSVKLTMLLQDKMRGDIDD